MVRFSFMFDPIYEYQPCETSSSLLLFTSTSYVEIIKNESDDTDKDHMYYVDVGTVSFFFR
jgi:hypothetical protein